MANLVLWLTKMSCVQRSMLAQLAHQIRARHGAAGGDEDVDGGGEAGQPIYIDDNCSVSSWTYS